MKIPPALFEPKFRALWLGSLISIAGSQMQYVAIHWHIRDLTGEPDPLALGLIGLARLIPTILFSALGGAIADNFDRRKISLIANISEMLTAIALAILTFSGSIQLWHIYFITALQGAAFSFDLPARQSITPNVVSRQNLANAFSLQSIAWNLGAVIGPVFSGWVIAGLGMGYTYVFNAISFLAVIFALLTVGNIPQDMTKRGGVNLAVIAEGFKFIFNQKLIFSTMIMDFFATFFANARTMLPIIARDILGVGEIGYGFLSSAEALGAMIAGLVLTQIRELRKQGKVFIVSLIFFGLATIMFGLSKNFYLSMFAMMLMGATDAVSMVIRNLIRQLHTPDNMRGRMTSVNQIFFSGGPQLGELEAGLVGKFFGIPFAIVTGGVGVLLSLAWVVTKYPFLRTYDKPDYVETV